MLKPIRMKPAIKIISFNIWDLPVPYNTTRRERVRQIISYLKKHDPDIICLQEAWDPVHRRRIHDELGRERYHAALNETFASRWLPFYNATGGLFTLSKFPVASEQFYAFKGFTASLTDWLGNKGFVESRIEAPNGDLVLINTHLCHLEHASKQLLRRRYGQFDRLLRHIEQSHDKAVIVAGDFNEDDIMKRKEFSERLTASGLIHPHLAEAPLAATYRHDNPFVDTWPNRVPSSQRYDYIFVRSLDKLGLSVEKYEPEYLNPVLSDHDPVVMTLT